MARRKKVIGEVIFDGESVYIDFSAFKRMQKKTQTLVLLKLDEKRISRDFIRLRMARISSSRRRPT